MSRWKKLGLLPVSMCGLGAALVLTLLFALAAVPLFLRGWLPVDHAKLFAAGFAGMAVFVSALGTVRLRGRQVLPTAGLIAVCYIILSALLCALGSSRCTFGTWLLHLSAAVFAGALMAVVLSLRKRRSRHRRR